MKTTLKKLAKTAGANEEVVENVYRTMIDSFINAEMNEFEHLKNKDEKFQWFYDSNKTNWDELSNKSEHFHPSLVLKYNKCLPFGH